LASSEEGRNEKAAELERRARNDKKCSLGVSTTKLDQLGDRTTKEAMQTAVEVFEKFADTIHSPERLQGQPLRALLMVDLDTAKRFGFPDLADLDWRLP
jgi:hypothetical protein